MKLRQTMPINMVLAPDSLLTKPWLMSQRDMPTDPTDLD